MNELEQTMTRYLLGELSESEQAALEERYFTDPQIFDEVLKTESELVDGYVRGELANEVREQFEQSYMAHPSRSNRVKFAAALATRLDNKFDDKVDHIEEAAPYSDERAEPPSWWPRLLVTLRGQRPTLRFSVAFAILLVMLGGVWIFVESRRQQQSRFAEVQAAREAEQRRLEREQSQQTAEQGRPPEESAPKQAAPGSNPQQITQPTPNPSGGSAPRSVSLALIVGGVRGGDSTQMPTLVIPPGTTQTRLLLNLKENNYPGYHASLRTIAGVEIFSQRDVKPARAKTGASFVFTVPAQKFAGGDYVLTLRGINPNGEVDDLSKSLFRVDKK